MANGKQISVKGGRGAPPHSAKDKLCKETGIFGSITLILALFGSFYGNNFRRFSVKGGEGPGLGVPPNSAKLFFLAKTSFAAETIGQEIHPTRKNIKTQHTRFKTYYI